jgi:hypothetical protein
LDSGMVGLGFLMMNAITFLAIGGLTLPFLAIVSIWALIALVIAGFYFFKRP